MFLPCLLVVLLTPTLFTPGAPPTPPTFATPVRLLEGERFLGAGRMYPSPVMFDVDGDGKLDMVIGDLVGKLTFSKRVDGRWQESQPLRDVDAKPLRFNNW